MFTFQRGWYPWENEACYANVSPDGYPAGPNSNTTAGYPDAGVFRRTLAVLEAANGGPIRRSLACSAPVAPASTSGWRLTAPPSTLTAWRIHRGQITPRSGRRSSERAGRQLDGCPGPMGLRRGGVDHSPAQEHLARYGGVRPSARCPPPGIASAGLRVENDRARVLDPDPSERKKRWIMCAKSSVWDPLWSRSSRMRPISALSPLRAAWGRRGQPLDVPISGHNARRVVFGTLTSHRASLFVARQRQRSEDFRAFLSVVAHHYRGTVGGVVAGRGTRATQPSFLWRWMKQPRHAVGVAAETLSGLNGMDHLWGHGKTTCAQSAV